MSTTGRGAVTAPGLKLRRSFGSLWQDVRFGARLLARNPGFSAVAILVLALGIGTLSAAFVLGDAVLLRPWPGRDPSSLAAIYQTWHGAPRGGISWAEYADIARNARTLSGVLGYERHGCFIGASEDSPLVLDDLVSRNYFSVLGLPMFLGRGFSPKRESQGSVVVGYDVWRGELGARRDIVGKTILINTRKVTVVGVAPRGFYGLDSFVRTHVWLPVDEWIDAKSLADHAPAGDVTLLARLRQGEKPVAVRSELAAIGEHEASAFPATNKNASLSLATLAERQRSGLPALLMLLGPAAIVLLIACGNVAGLLLARAEGRRREIAIRLALGATRMRLVRQMLTESCLLALPAAALGLLLVHWLAMLEPALLPPYGIEIGGPSLRLDVPALAFAIAATVASVLVFGLAPALSARKGDLASAGRGGTAAAQAHGGRKIGRSVMVVAQIALATTLLTAGGLLFRSLLYSSSINPGFDVHGKRWLFTVSLGGGPNAQALRSKAAALLKQPNGREAAMALAEKAMQADRTELRERVLGVPGVRDAAWCQRFPLTGSGGGVAVQVAAADATSPELRAATEIKYDAVDPGYFHLVGTRLLAGRAFASTDTADSEPVALVSQTMAIRYWPGQSALGRELTVDGKRTTVVGVAEDVKVNDLHEAPEPYLYIPLAQHMWGEDTLVVLADRSAGPAVETLRSAMRAADPGIYFQSTMPVEQLMSQALWQDRTQSGAAGAIAGMGVLLAAVGLFAVMDYSVRRRTPEFGVRMAMGATPGDVLAIVLRAGLWLALTGCAIGLAAGFAASRLLRSVLYGITPSDPVTYISVAALLAIVALVATFLPARRATRVDPSMALRWE